MRLHVKKMLTYPLFLTPVVFSLIWLIFIGVSHILKSTGSLTIAVPPTTFHRKVAEIAAKSFKETGLFKMPKIVTLAPEDMVGELKDLPSALRRQPNFDIFIGDAEDIFTLSENKVLSKTAEWLPRESCARESAPCGDPEIYKTFRSGAAHESSENAVHFAINNIPLVYATAGKFTESPKNVSEVFALAARHTVPTKMQFGLEFPAQTGFVPLAFFLASGALAVQFTPETTTLVWNKEDLQNLGKQLEDAAHLDLSMPIACDGECAFREFSKNNGTFFVSGNWRLPAMEKLGNKIKTMPIPPLRKGEANPVLAGALYMGLKSDLPAERVERARNMLFKLLENDKQELLLKDVGLLPVKDTAGKLQQKYASTLYDALFNTVFILPPVSAFAKLEATKKEVGRISQEFLEAEISLDIFTDAITAMR